MWKKFGGAVALSTASPDSCGFEETNQKLYGRSSVVRWHSTRDALQGAESAVLDEMREQLATMRMLDVGVGGGRTTRHFAPLVRSYVGVDYVPEMVAACQRRFAGTSYGFHVADARKLSAFADASFDFVLFSHCGMDYVGHEDREAILHELRRVLVPGGILCFATHNLSRTADLFASPQAWWRWLDRRRVRRLRHENQSWESLVTQDHALLNDGAFNWALRTYHVRPSAQLSTLEGMGFRDSRVLHRTTGADLNVEAADASIEPWLYYVARNANGNANADAPVSAVNAYVDPDQDESASAAAQ